MSDFVYGQLVEMDNTFGSVPSICRYVKMNKDGYVLHKHKLSNKSPFILHKYIKNINPNELLMIPGRSYRFKPGDEVIYRVRKNHLSDPVDEIGVVAEVNDEWKFVVLTEPVISTEDSRVLYFEQVLLKREYDSFKS